MKKSLIILSFLAVSTAWAHPHAFIDMQTAPVIQNNQLIGFSMKWTLDEPSSAAVLYDMKQAQNQEAQQKLLDEVIQNIVNEHYFSYLYDSQNNKIKYRAQPQHYGVNKQGLQVQYYFEMPLARPQSLEKNTFTLQTYDPTYYVAMHYEAPSAVDFSALPAQCQGKLIEPNVNEQLQSYASSLDKSQKDEDDSLGVNFSQKLVIQCE